MMKTAIPPRGKPLFSKSVPPKFWQGRGYWDPLSTKYKPSTTDGLPRTRPEVLAEMVQTASDYEHSHDIKFASLTQFSRSLLKELHSPEELNHGVYGEVQIVSNTDATVLDCMDRLTRIANSPCLSPDDRREFFNSLMDMYVKFPRTPIDLCRDHPDTLCIGIRREGHILCEKMNWYASEYSFSPELKRIPFHGGLLVGSTDLTSAPSCSRIAIVDGAIASGATIITLIERLRDIAHLDEVHVFSVHSGLEGLNAITRYCRSIRVRVSITVGHATRGINAKFYAIDAAAPSRLIVGDLGDTISDLGEQ
jgi:hypothetical protein